MLALPQAVPLIARHSSKYMVVHSLCLVAFKSIMLCEMTVTQVSSTKSFSTICASQTPSRWTPLSQKSCRAHPTSNHAAEAEQKEGTFQKAS